MVRLVVALIGGAAFALPAGLILPWMIGVLPSEATRSAFLDFELQQNSAIGIWLVASLMLMAVRHHARWLWLLSGLGALFWAIPIFTALFLADIAAREVGAGGGPMIAMAFSGAVLGSVSVWGLQRIKRLAA